MRSIYFPLTVLGLTALVLSDPIASVVARAKKTPENIALDKSYALHPAPNYAPCTDPDDKVQLTDGEKLGTTDPDLPPWVQAPMVGWVKTRTPVMITVDLEEEEAISGLAFRTAAGGGSVAWPAQIAVFIGKDNKNWNYLGNLRALSDAEAIAPSDGGGYGGLVVHEFTAGNLQTSARYVRFVITGSVFVFCDEVEIYSGDPAWIQENTQEAAIHGDEEIYKFVESQKTRAGYESRLLIDVYRLDDQIGSSSFSSQEKKSLQERLWKGYEEAKKVELPPDNEFRAVIPFNEAHAKMFSIQGELLNRKLGDKTVISKIHRYEWLSFDHQPERQKSGIVIGMLKDEVRSDMLLLSNPSGTAREIKMEVDGIEGEPRWLRLFSVPWTDTLERMLVSTALEEINPQENSFLLPAGITQKLWLMVDSSKLPAGQHSGNLIISDTAGKQTIPFKIEVSAVAMSKPELDIYLWDYAQLPSYYGLREGNLAPTVQLMKDYFVNTAWGNFTVFPRATENDFDAENQLKAPLDFSKMDKWMLQTWPGAEHYLFYMTLNNHPGNELVFAGAKSGTEAFEQRVTAWLRAITSRMEEIGVDPKKLVILPFDEPHKEQHFKIAAGWNETLKKADPRVLTYINPATPDVATMPTHGALESADIICPNTLVYQRGTAEDDEVYKKLVESGKEFHFYLCGGPVRIADPNHYYRLHFWFALPRNVSAIGYWSIADTGRAASSWNEYTAKGTSFSPAFLDDNSAIPTIHMEALREGAEDYALFAMLQDACEKAPSSSKAKQAQKLLERAYRLPEEGGTTEAEADQFKSGLWFQMKAPETPDNLRLQAIEFLEDLN